MVNNIKKINSIKTAVLMLTLMLFVLSSFSVTAFQVSQPMTDTGQNYCYSNDGQISFSSQNSQYFGKDAQYTTNPMAYSIKN
ncbi:MAG: hypothetical protein L3J69_04945 [Desulfobacula sp.]|nr:hypothetical protein [Desulfobacula sp.]